MDLYSVKRYIHCTVYFAGLVDGKLDRGSARIDVNNTRPPCLDCRLPDYRGFLGILNVIQWRCVRDEEGFELICEFSSGGDGSSVGSR